MNRYNVWSDYAGNHEAVSKCGKWCKWESVKRLEAENKRLRCCGNCFYLSKKSHYPRCTRERFAPATIGSCCEYWKEQGE